mmetsp:Transcript_16388/g.29629  ORF Transcript_16388/g.29629 Transcript_16388/m.29629 type:complete len:402 (-) Transcript_16388:287-1492(-)
MSWNLPRGRTNASIFGQATPSREHLNSVLITSGLLRSCAVQLNPQRDDDNPLHLFKKPVEPSREVKVKMHGYEQFDDSIDIRHRNKGIPSILTFGEGEEHKGRLPSPKQQEVRVESKFYVDNPLTPKQLNRDPSTPLSEPKIKPFNPLDHVALSQPTQTTQPGDKPQDVQVAEQEPVAIVKPESEYLETSQHVIDNFDKFEYLLSLEREVSGWSLKINKPYAQVGLKQGSLFNQELPVVRAVFDMEMDLKPQDLYYVLYDVNTRLGWDSGSVVEYAEFEKLSHDCILYYMQNKAPWPFSNRDFVERRLLRTRRNGDLEIYYSAISHSAYPERNKIERGMTIVGGQIFRRKQNANGSYTLMVTVISQADMKGKIPAKALQETLPSSLEKWYKTVRAAVIARQ